MASSWYVPLPVKRAWKFFWWDTLNFGNYPSLQYFIQMTLCVNKVRVSIQPTITEISSELGKSSKCHRILRIHFKLGPFAFQEWRAFTLGLQLFPRVRTSVGLWSDLMYLRASEPIVSWISATLTEVCFFQEKKKKKLSGGGTWLKTS